MRGRLPGRYPVTRRCPCPSPRRACCRWRRSSEFLRVAEQSHAQAFGHVDLVAVHQGAAVGDHQRELAAHHAADVDLVADHLRVRQHLAAELDLSHAQRAPAPGFAQPGQVETGELPHRTEEPTSELQYLMRTTYAV